MHFSSFFFLLVTTPISLLNNFYFRIIAIFFSPSYPLLLIFLLFFPSHIFSLSFLLFRSIFFPKPLQAWTAARAHARTRTRTRTRGCRLVVRCFTQFIAIFFANFRNFSPFLPLSNQPDVSIFGRHFATHIFKIFAFFSATFREKSLNLIQQFRVFFCKLSVASHPAL